MPERGSPASLPPRGRALGRTGEEWRAGPARRRVAASAARPSRVRAREYAPRSRYRPARRGRRFCAAALTLLAVGCASGPAARPAQEAVGPAPADAQLVVTVRQPLLDDLFSHFDVNALLPPGLETDAATLSASTQRLVLSLRPQERGATLALVPAGRYPAQLMGWQLHLSDLAFQTVDDSGVRHYWSNPVTGFGILVFPNLIFMFWLDPYVVDVSDASDPEVREMIRIALEGSPVAIHAAALGYTAGAHLFAYLTDTVALAEQYDPTIGPAAARVPTRAAWVSGRVPDAGDDGAGAEVALRGGVAVEADDPEPFVALTRLLLVTLLRQFDLLTAARLRGVEVSATDEGIIDFRGLEIPRPVMVELLGAMLGEDDPGGDDAGR